MKKLMLLLFLLISTIGIAQTKTKVPGSDNIIYTLDKTEEKPELLGDMTFDQYFKKNFHVTEKMSEPLTILFTVEKVGLALDIHVAKDVGAGAGKEAIRVIKSAPKWKPGKINGKIVRVLYRYTVQN